MSPLALLISPGHINEEGFCCPEGLSSPAQKHQNCPNSHLGIYGLNNLGKCGRTRETRGILPRAESSWPQSPVPVPSPMAAWLSQKRMLPSLGQPLALFTAPEVKGNRIQMEGKGSKDEKSKSQCHKHANFPNSILPLDMGHTLFFHHEVEWGSREQRE